VILDTLSSRCPESIERRIQEWISKLTDSSKNSKLLYCKPSSGRVLDLLNYDPHVLNQLLAGQSVPLTLLSPALAPFDMETEALIDSIWKRALSNHEEKGISTLFLAIGIASWTVLEGQEAPTAPVLMLPMSIQKGRQLQPQGNAQINPVLLQVLETQLQCPVKAETLLYPVEEDETPDPIQLLNRLATETAGIPGFSIKRRVVLGNFGFHKMAIVEDLKAHLKELASHPVITMLAGDQEQPAQPPNSTDAPFSWEEFLVFPADSSQKKVIQAVLQNHPLTVIQGPPGTGKSQTIANLIAILAAHNKRVLFVSQKHVALEAVQRKLQKVDLGHLLLDLHSYDSGKKIIEQFQESWEIVQVTPRFAYSDIEQQLASQVKFLDRLTKRLHNQHPLTSKSIYEMQQELSQFLPEEQVTVTFPNDGLKKMDREDVAMIEADLHKLGDEELSSLFLQTDSSAWMEASRLPSQQIAQQLLEAIKQILDEHWPAFKESLSDLLMLTGVKVPETLHQAGEYLNLFGSINVTFALYANDLFEEDLADYVQRLQPEGVWSKLCVPFSKVFKETQLRLRCLRVAGKVTDRQLLQEVAVAAEQQRQWRSLSSHQPIPCRTESQTTQVRQYWQVLMDLLTFIQPYLKQQDLHTLRFEELLNYLRRLAAEPTVPAKLARVQELEQRIASHGAGAMIAFLKRSQPDPKLWPKQFRYIWLKSNLEEALKEQPPQGPFDWTCEPALKDIDWNDLEGDITKLRQLSEKQRQRAVERIHAAHAENVITTMERYPPQEARVKEEIKKKSHKHLSPFFVETFDVLTSLRTCWMMSPLSVSQLLDSRCKFDVIIFDEASQIRVEEAAPAIYRGSQVVVVGDLKQLSPLDLSSGQGRSQSVLEHVECLDSVKSHCLRWHYRSCKEDLIDFSNKHFYDNRLITFPSASKRSSISAFVIEQNPDRSPLENREAFYARVVEQGIQQCLALLRPDSSCLFITPNTQDAGRLRKWLASKLKTIDGLSSVEFRVKSLQNVQGDEADLVIWSLFRIKKRSGKLVHQFGALGTEGGELLLNVGASRARQGRLIYSSFASSDIKPELCSNPAGAEGLKILIGDDAQDQENGVTSRASEDGLDAFERDVFHTLTARGLKLEPLVGLSKAQIRLTVLHPDRPDQFVLALATDGPYHDDLFRDVQDRYLLWSEQLEERGFKVHRIWSIDWYQNREKVIERVLKAFQEAVKVADQTDAAPRDSTDQASPPHGHKSDNSIPRSRGPRPRRSKRKLADYSVRDFEELIRWIESDGIRRTENDVLEAMKEELKPQQVSKHERQLRKAIQQYRSQRRPIAIDLSKVKINPRLA